MKIKRGGKHLEYFKENRIINNYLVQQARDHQVPVINNLDLDNTKKRMLTIIRENCTELVLQHNVDQLEEVTNIVLNKYGGRIVDVSYFLPGFGEPLKRKVNVYDPVEAERFINLIKNNPKRRKDLQGLYELSDNIHSNQICAPDEESLQNIIEELEERGLVYHPEPKT
jgi:hypothetical protein